jgi:hypothetical protein
VSPLFRKNEEKVAREAAGRLEFDRLMALPVSGLAGALMPAFAPDGLQPPARPGFRFTCFWSTCLGDQSITAGPLGQ